MLDGELKVHYLPSNPMPPIQHRMGQVAALKVNEQVPL